MADAPVAQEQRGGLGVLATVLSVSAGVVVFVYLMGGAVLWVRLEAAHLPATQALTVLPRQLFAVVGLSELVIPTALAGAVMLTLEHVTKLYPPKDRPERQPVKGWRVVLIAVIGLALIALLFPLDATGGILAGAFIATLVYLALERRRREQRGDEETVPPPREVILFSMVVVALCVLALQLEGPAHFESADVRESNSARAHGLFLTKTSDAVYLGVRRDIVVIPADNVERIAIHPTPSQPRGHRSLLNRLTGIGPSGR